MVKLLGLGGRIKSGKGGGISMLAGRLVVLLLKLPDWASGLELEGKLPDRICLSVRMEPIITWPPSGGAVTTVPGVAVGGGVQLSDRNKGWM
jgi:hypothetical protein